MKKVVITIWGKTYTDLSVAAEHASNMLRQAAPSENCEWEDKSRVDYTVQEDATAEYKELYEE